MLLMHGDKDSTIPMSWSENAKNQQERCRVLQRSCWFIHLYFSTISFKWNFESEGFKAFYPV